MNVDTSPDIQIIIPAAGASRRLGQAKQEVQLKGVPLWRVAVQRASGLGYPIQLVTGNWVPENNVQHEQITLIHNSDWQSGMGSSIALAIREAKTPKLGYLVLLVDQWGISSSALDDFVQTWDRQRIQIASESAYSGPPALFPVSMKDELTKLTGDAGARHIIQQRNPKRVAVPNASWDLDTPEDLFLLEQLTNKKTKQERMYDHS